MCSSCSWLSQSNVNASFSWVSLSEAVVCFQEALRTELEEEDGKGVGVGVGVSVGSG